MRRRIWILILLLGIGTSRQLYPQRAVSVDPSTSRPPLLLNAPGPEANRQVRELALMVLIQALQSGDPDLFDLVVGDLAIEEQPRDASCRSVREGMQAVKTMQTSRREEPTAALPIYGDRITQRDSAEATIAEFQLVVIPKGGSEARSPARLTYDNSEARWRTSKGIVEGLCGVGRRQESP